MGLPDHEIIVDETGNPHPRERSLPYFLSGAVGGDIRAIKALRADFAALRASGEILAKKSNKAEPAELDAYAKCLMRHELSLGVAFTYNADAELLPKLEEKVSAINSRGAKRRLEAGDELRFLPPGGHTIAPLLWTEVVQSAAMFSAMDLLLVRKARIVDLVIRIDNKDMKDELRDLTRTFPRAFSARLGRRLQRVVAESGNIIPWLSMEKIKTKVTFDSGDDVADFFCGILHREYNTPTPEAKARYEDLMLHFKTKAVDLTEQLKRPAP
ncbi:MAG: hypothetical protein HUU15_07660 [Candidatus Brocadiae bacterium]|nr:hypothetical protein [Candidatus Brocadiia bacterium]